MFRTNIFGGSSTGPLADANKDLSDSLRDAIVYVDVHEDVLGNKIYEILYPTLEKLRIQANFIDENQKCPDNIVTSQELTEWSKKVDKKIPASWISFTLFELGL